MRPTYWVVTKHDFATGEGGSRSILITRAYPRQEDYGENGMVIHTEKFRAIREFAELNSTSTLCGMEVFTYDEAPDYLLAYIPDVVKKIVCDDISPPGNFFWWSQMNVNFS